MPRKWSLSRVLVIVFLLIGLVMTGFQIWSAAHTPALVQQVRDRVTKVAPQDIDHEKAREELVERRLANESKGSIETDLAAAFGILAPLLVALSGAILALQGYLDSRKKERLDSSAAALNETLKRLVASEARERMIGAAGLQHFFAPDQEDFRLQALAALVAAARGKDTAEVQHSLRLAAERAFRDMPRKDLTQVSWQGVKLAMIGLSGCDLRQIDFRDAELPNARLEGARLEGADLTASQLQGARLAKANLAGAVLAYADLAGASLAGADLRGANIDDIKVLDLDIDGADLRGISGDWRKIPWDKAQNWRAAKFDAPVQQELIRRYGPGSKGPRVLMLMWEIPPLVAGGTWTACYHLVRNLRRHGADVTIVVPWDRASILTAPFGGEVTIVPLGIVPPQDVGSPYTTGNAPSWSAYGGGSPLWSSYGRSPAPVWSSYGAPYGYGAPGVYGSYGSYDAPSLSGSILFRLIGEFRRRLERYVADHGVDVIHAHDWVTFEAARGAAALRKLPWIAHIHSTEADRRPDGGDPLIERIERRAVEVADLVVTPSSVTRRRVLESYGAAELRVHVVPNGLSPESIPLGEMGRFEARRVVFVGRLTRQKGIDRFCEIAAAVRRQSDARFEVFGDGEERGRMLRSGAVTWRRAIGWDRRGEAFRDASLVVVPSRAEPFGMVILEAMEHRVPVIYPADSGAAEVLKAGIAVPAQDLAAVSAEVLRLLGNLADWETTVEEQAREIFGYPERKYETRLIELWDSVVSPTARTARAAADKTRPADRV